MYFLLQKKDRLTELRRLETGTAEAILPEELGLRLSSLFMFDRLVFVEGPSDESVIRELASIMQVNLGRAAVGFVLMRGVRNFAHYANQEIINLLTRRQVKVWFVLDRDERDDADVTRLEQQLGATATMHVLERRELENYLLHPRPLSEFINAKRAASSTSDKATVSETQVTELLDSVVEGLRTEAVVRRVLKVTCSPLYPNRKIDARSLSDLKAEIDRDFVQLRSDLESRLNDLEELFSRASNDVQAQWQQRKLELVPGDMMIDEICKQFGVRYKKERDGSKLARYFRDSEIPSELRSLIREIGND